MARSTLSRCYPVDMGNLGCSPASRSAGFTLFVAVSTRSFACCGVRSNLLDLRRPDNVVVRYPGLNQQSRLSGLRNLAADGSTGGLTNIAIGMPPFSVVVYTEAAKMAVLAPETVPCFLLRNPTRLRRVFGESSCSSAMRAFPLGTSPLPYSSMRSAKPDARRYLPKRRRARSAIDRS